MSSRRILTVHSPVPPAALDDLLTAVEKALHRAGATRIWIDARFVPELVVMADFAGEELEQPVVVTVGDEACSQVLPDLPAPRGA
jgi:hypothetical protein